MNYLKPIITNSVSYGCHVGKCLIDIHNPKAMVNLLAHPIAFGQSVPDIITKIGAVASLSLLGIALLTNSVVHLSLAVIILTSSGVGMLLSYVTNDTYACLDLEASVEKSTKGIDANGKKLTEQADIIEGKIEGLRKVAEKAEAVAEQIGRELEEKSTVSDTVKEQLADSTEHSAEVALEISEKAEVLAVSRGRCDQPTTAKAKRLHQIMQKIRELTGLEAEYEAQIEAATDPDAIETLEEEQDEINLSIVKLERERNAILNEGVDK